MPTCEDCFWNSNCILYIDYKTQKIKRKEGCLLLNHYNVSTCHYLKDAVGADLGLWDDLKRIQYVVENYGIKR
jgi:hypothetical protein